MLKKTLATVLMFCASFSAVNADQWDCCTPVVVACPCEHTTGVTVGGGVTTLLNDTKALLTVGYVDDWFTADIGGNFERLTHKPVNVASLISHVGLRNPLSQKLFVTYGAVGAVGLTRHHADRHWAAGAFVGLDMHLGTNFLLSGKIYPYNYQHEYTGAHQHEVFANGTLTLAYLF